MSNTTDNLRDDWWESLSNRSGHSRKSVKLRVIVVFGDAIFPEEKRVIVPTPHSTTVVDFIGEAVRRAQALGLTLSSTEDLVLHTKSGYGPIAFGEDTIGDVLDPRDAIVWIVKADSTTNQSGPNSLIYIRWVTASRALDYETLSSIPAEEDPINAHTTLKDSKSTAIDCIYKSGEWAEASGASSNFGVELFLAACHLSTTDEQTTTLHDLGCAGSLSDPLTFFVVPRRDPAISQVLSVESLTASGASTISGEKSYTIWGFACSDRGIATFQTCLAILMAEVYSNPTVLRHYLKVFFKSTHFPPVIGALQVLGIANQLLPMSVLIFATCVRELALRMVPPCATSGGVEASMEGARQIFAWMESQHCESILDEVDDPTTALSKSVEFEEVEGNLVQTANPNERIEVVELFAAGEPIFDSNSTKSRTLRRVIVRAPLACREDLRRLALSMWGNYDGTMNYYVDLRNFSSPWQHTLVLPPHLVRPGDMRDFKPLLLFTNTSRLFRMVRPTELDDEIYSRCITLCKDGLVSLYNVNYKPCADPEHWVKNVICGDEILKGESPGQDLAPGTGINYPAAKG